MPRYDAILPPLLNGPFTVTCEGRSPDQLHKALQLFARASASHLLGPSASMTLDATSTDSRFPVHAHELPSDLWAIVVNILYFDGKAPGTLCLQGEGVEARIPLEPTPFDYPLPEPVLACDLSSLLDHMDSFVLRFEFGDSQSPEQRDAVCDALEAWAALVDAHGFPMSASITYGSAIAGPDARFEDPATACLGAEGIAANPNCFGLLIHLANHLHAQAGLEQMTLECTG